MTTHLTHMSDKMMRPTKMDKTFVKLMAFMLQIASCTSKFHCPSAVELNSNVTMTCSFPNRTSIYYYSPTEPSDHVAVCLRNGNCSVTDSRYSATYLNLTHGQLDIHNVMKGDDGRWNCKDVNGPTTSTCTVAVIKTPSCFIQGNRDTINLALNKNASLQVNITDFYCSQKASFSLQTGDRREELENHNQLTRPDPGMYYSVFIVTNGHRGSVGLLFTCNNVTTKVQCGGVTSLGIHLQEESDPTILIAILVSASVVLVVIVVIIVICVRRKACSGTSEGQHSSPPTTKPPPRPDNHQTDNTGKSEGTHIYAQPDCRKSGDIKADIMVHSSQYDKPKDVIGRGEATRYFVINLHL